MDNYLNQEVRDGYIISTETKKLWSVEMDLLLELDRVCNALDIKYFLDCGTLLGAVRNNQFIPWDDDVDVVMLRADYDILVNKAPELFADDFFFQCAYTDHNYPRGHAQLRKKNTCAMITYEAKRVQFDQGIFIDIFVLDGLSPVDEELKKQFSKKNKLFHRMNIIGIPASTKPINTLIKRIIRCIYMALFPPIPVMARKYEEICKWHSDSEFVDKIMARMDINTIHRFRKEWFEESILWEFEGYKFPIPKDYSLVLEELYGKDYMIPKKEATYHGGLIIDTERSYSEVLKEL